MANLSNAQNVIKAMVAAGQSPETIVDRVINTVTVDENIRTAFKNAKLAKQSSEIVNDFVNLSREDVGTRSLVSKEDLKTPGKLGSVARFIGVEPLGRYLGAQAAKLSPEHRENLRTLRERSEESAAKELSTGGVSRMQLAGSIAATGANIALPFLGKALSAGTLGTRAVSSAALQGSLSAAQSLSESGSYDDALSAAKTGAIFGVSLPVLGLAFRGLGSASKTLPETFYSKFFRADADDIAKLMESRVVGKEINPSLAKEVLDTGIHGSAEGMGTAFAQLRRLTGEKLHPIAQSIKEKIPVDRKYVKRILNVIKLGYGGKDALSPQHAQQINLANSWLKKLNKTNKLSADDVLSIKQFIDDARISSSFRMNPALSDKQEAFKQVADTLRNKLHSLKNTTLSEQLVKYRIFTSAFDNLAKEAVRERNARLINYLDAISIAAGISVGLGFDQPAYGGALFAIPFIQRAARSPRVLTGLGQTITRGEKFLSEPRALKIMGRTLKEPIGEGIRTLGRQAIRTLSSQFSQ